MLEKNRMISKIFFIALVVFFITTVSHAQGIFGNSSSSSQTNVDSSQNISNTNTTNNTTNNTMIDSSQNISNTNTTDNSSVMNIEMGDPNIPLPMGDPNQDMHNVDNSQITGQASPRWVRDIDWATCVQQRFNDGESFMASRGACN